MRLILPCIIATIWLPTVLCEESNVEVLVYVDQALNLRLINNENTDTIKYVENILSIVNLIYSNIRPKIRFAISNIWIENVNHGPLTFITNVLFSGKTENSITLFAMKSWVTEKADNADVVLAFTGLDLCRHPMVKDYVISNQMHRFYETFDQCNSSTAGSAFIGGACNTENVAIVEGHDNILHTASTVAHEIGHLLNLTHDGDVIENELWCNASDGHIMVGIWEGGLWEDLLDFIRRTSNGNLWSPCSKAQFDKYVPNYKCLENKPEEEKYPLQSDFLTFANIIQYSGLFKGWIYYLAYVIGNDFVYLLWTLFGYYKVLYCLIPYYYKKRNIENDGFATRMDDNMDTDRHEVIDEGSQEMVQNLDEKLDGESSHDMVQRLEDENTQEVVEKLDGENTPDMVQKPEDENTQEVVEKLDGEGEN